MMNFDRFACDMGVKVRAAKGKKDAEGCQTLWSCTAELLLIVQELSTCSGKDQTEQVFSTFCPGHVPQPMGY